MMKKWITALALLLVVALLLPAGAMAAGGDKLDVFSVEVEEDLDYNGYIVKVRDGVEEKFSSMSCVTDQVLDDMFVVDSLEDVQARWSSRDIEYIEPNYILELYAAPNDPYYSYQWCMSYINAEYAWDAGVSGNGVRVAIVDSGIVMGHEDFNYDNFILGQNYITGTSNVTDIDGHGTVISGIIAAVRDNGVGVAGLLDDVTLVHLKAFEKGEAEQADVVRAIYDAVNVYEVDVINMSFGLSGNGGYTALKQAVEYAAANNVLMVAAAGNEGGTALSYPAAWDEVIGVGAVDRDGVVADFSRVNESVFVTAPGQGLIGVGYAHSESYLLAQQGTSFAAPYVTAMAAMARGVRHDMTTQEFQQLLIASAVDAGPAGYDPQYGYGIIDLQRFVGALPESNWVAGFRDITGHWAVDSIQYVVEEGLFNGTTSYTFSPDTTMSRAMFITAVGRLYESRGGTVPAVDDTFADTEKGSYYSRYVAWGTANGLVDGHGDNRFAPDDPITREQMATLLARYADFTGLDTTASASALNQFPDGSRVSDWARDGVAWAVENSLITGINEGGTLYIKPGDTTTRAEVATILERFDTNLGASSLAA